MKKLLCMAFAVLCLSACGGGDKETKTMNCKLENDLNGIKTVMNIDMDYQGSTVISQKQNAVMTASSEEIYEAMVPTLKTYSKEEAYKDMEGVTYSLSEDDAKLNMVENITIDFEKISAADYRIVSGDPNIDISKDKIDIDKTKENLEKGKYTCKK
ncbi:hypothetical protein [Amedibacillus sp. YH-ame10]